MSRAHGAVHTALATCELMPGGWTAAHAHDAEELVFVLGGRGMLTSGEGVLTLAAGEAAFVPLGCPHAWRAEGDEPWRWVELHSPQPRTSAATAAEHADLMPVRAGAWAARDDEAFAALAVEGIAITMLIDERQRASLAQMFLVDYAPGAVLAPHDHPFEETFSVLDGEVVYRTEAAERVLRVGDVAYAGVGCVHGFENRSSRPVRWLETRAPQPPRHHANRFVGA
ncbi:cupin domain-containing protein [Baekduia alba]|uniref:cupin domain-containing protein n=1 Tax=Baekduia alba TaxID=2997333 RepID=UPI0023420048|nr:cupin domain-containing protein [Baekduia alba]